MRYKYIGTEERIFPTLGLDLKPGEEFDYDGPIVSPLVEEIQPTEAKKSAYSSKAE